MLPSWVAWIPWPCRRCSDSIRWSCCRAGLVVRSHRNATEFRSARGRASHCSTRKPRARCGFSAAGESADAYHMSSPHPEGAGAATAMRKALSSAGLAGRDIDYINLHGTASRANDLAEDRGVVSAVGKEPAGKLDQGMDRTPARRGGHHRGGDQRCLARRSMDTRYAQLRCASIRRCTATFASIRRLCVCVT